MELESVSKGLHPLEIKVLLEYSKADSITPAGLAKDLAFNTGQCNQAASWLASKGLIAEKERATRVSYELTELGRVYLEQGTPESRIVELVKKKGSLTLPEIAAELGLDNKDVGSAFGSLSKEGVLAMDAEKKAAVKDLSKTGSLDKVIGLIKLVSEKGSVDEAALSAENKEIASANSKKRGSGKGIFRYVEREEVAYVLTEDGEKLKAYMLKQGMTGEEIGMLTPAVLKGEEWKTRGFRGYNINVPPARLLIGRKNPYVEFLELLKDKLVSLGFEEFDGPLSETEFWNSDALFMPQFHSARDIHDVFYVQEPTHAKKIDEPYLSQVAQSHENGWKTGSRGWRYKFDRDFTRRLILRSQGTVMSAKTLTRAKIPGKYFGVVRCFRPDTVDATHSADFYQTEGIVLGEEVNLKNLLGLLRVFAVEVAGAKEVKYVPAYFPFTEPSVEVHIKHPELGWFELGGSGIFRPEVTEPLGIKVPVLAWGLGIDRMALMSLGLNDLRDLFTDDIEQVRLRRRKG